jgi:beta-glucanase (GH16 family)
MRVVEYATRSPNSTPTPAPGLTPPPQASAAGFHTLSFDEEFSGPLDIGFGTTGHKWNAGLWWEAVPPASDFVVSNHVLTITGRSSSIGSAGGVDLCTQYHDASGGTSFLGGYFEARLMATDWSAFWLYCWDRPTVFGSLIQPSNPLTCTNEIDIVETDPKYPNTVFCTLHKNSSSDVVPDAQNNPDFFPMPNGGSVFGQWHTYGLLWTQSSVAWYVDNVKVASVAPYPSTWQPVQLILTASAGGVAGSASNVLPPITQVQWVHVWK